MLTQLKADSNFFGTAHPSNSETNLKIIHEFMSRYGNEEMIIIPELNDDTTELIYISDVVINKHSTAGQEVIALHKPMLILDFTSDIKQNPYVLEGVGIPVSSPDMLKDTLTNLCILLNRTSENQDKYIRNHLYKLDGLSSQRVAKIIMQHIIH